MFWLRNKKKDFGYALLFGGLKDYGMIFAQQLSISYGVQWLRVLGSRPRGHGFEPHWHHCVVSLGKNINPSLVLVQPRKARSYITERLLVGCKESNKKKRSISCGLTHILTRHPDKSVLEFFNESIQ